MINRLQRKNAKQRDKSKNKSNNKKNKDLFGFFEYIYSMMQTVLRMSSRRLLKMSLEYLSTHNHKLHIAIYLSIFYFTI